MDRQESFIDSIDDGVLSPQPCLTPVAGNDCCKGVWVIGTKEREAARTLIQLSRGRSALMIKHKHNYLHNFWDLLPSVCLLKKVLSRRSDQK